MYEDSSTKIHDVDQIPDILFKVSHLNEEERMKAGIAILNKNLIRLTPFAFSSGDPLY